jgi:hypothetical protein
MLASGLPAKPSTKPSAAPSAERGERAANAVIAQLHHPRVSLAVD